MAIGPWGLGLFDDVENVLHLAEFGVVLLLFVIGLELQPSRLWALRHSVFGAGAAQVVLTTAVLAAAIMALGTPWAAALVIAFALSLSSTALVLQVLAERGELTARHGRASFAILLFQDLAIMPALVLLPLLAGQADTQLDWRAIALPVAAIFVVVLAGRFLLRPALRIVAATRVQEAFTAAALLVVVGTALLFDVRRPLDGARRVRRRRAARRQRVSPRARSRHRAVQGPAAGLVLHRRRHDGQPRRAGRATARDRRPHARLPGAQGARRVDRGAPDAPRSADCVAHGGLARGRRRVRVRAVLAGRRRWPVAARDRRPAGSRASRCRWCSRRC